MALPKTGTGDTKRIGGAKSAFPGRSGNGPNFNYTGGNTGAPIVSPAKAKVISRKSQKNNFDNKRLAHTDAQAGRTPPPRGGGRSFMND